MATIPGGSQRGFATLSPAERVAAQNALTKLKSAGGGVGQPSGVSAPNATVYSGSAVKPGALGAPSLLHGQGSDTFMGGARGLSIHLAANIGTDTVVSGSATTFGGRTSAADAVRGGHGSQNFSLSADTVNVAGVTAEQVMAEHQQGAVGNSQTITLADKTTITVSGLSQNHLAGLQH